MAAAANIQEAIDDVVTYVQPGSPNGQMTAWVNNMFRPAGFNALAVGSAKFWDAKNADQRTVFDWVIPTLWDQRRMQKLGETVLSSDILINVVLRTLLAVQAAKVGGRITQDQEDTVVAAYNASF